MAKEDGLFTPEEQEALEMLATQVEIDSLVSWQVKNWGEIRLFQVGSFLHIPIKNRQAGRYFCGVEAATSAQIHSLEGTKTPWEIFLRGTEDTKDIEAIARELPAFIHEKYPQANDVPIVLYESFEACFMTKTPSVRINRDEKLISVTRFSKLSGNSQPNN